MSTAYCQSCGMPLTTPGLLGTETDGAKNEDYCVYCYANGAFTMPEATMAQMIEFCVPFLVKQGMQEEQARGMMQETFPRLKRWQAR